jgi:uncharacterized short protein YbdD (DUF466 family)
MTRFALARAWNRCVAIARRVAGIPDYDAYVAHLRRRHPERTLPSRETFFRERLAARYRAGGGRCC